MLHDTKGVLRIPSKIDNRPVVAIGNNTFKREDFITSVQIPDTVTLIGDSAFMSCENLLEVWMADSVATLDYAAFGDCKALERVRLSQGLTAIGGRPLRSAFPSGRSRCRTA